MSKRGETWGNAGKMRRLSHLYLTCLICLTVSQCFAQVIQRPTTDVDGGATTLLGCSGKNIASAAMPLGYDNAGNATSSGQTTTGDTTSIRYKTRIFKGIKSTGAAYTALTLNVYASSDGWKSFEALPGNACVAYSIDNGISWTSMQCDGTVSGGNGFSGPSTATLSATQDVTQVQVGVCSEGFKEVGGLPGEDSITVSDIYLLGTVTSQSGGTGSSVGNAQRGVVVVN